MGEWSKKVGETGESIAADFLRLVGWDARFWRNSEMKSFAGNRSWKFCGRPGVNASTA